MRRESQKSSRISLLARRPAHVAGWVLRKVGRVRLVILSRLWHSQASTLSNARRFYSSIGNPLGVKGLIRCDLIFMCTENVLYRELYNFYVLCVNCLNVLIELGAFTVTSQITSSSSSERLKVPTSLGNTRFRRGKS